MVEEIKKRQRRRAIIKCKLKKKPEKGESSGRLVKCSDIVSLIPCRLDHLISSIFILSYTEKENPISFDFFLLEGRTKKKKEKKPTSGALDTFQRDRQKKKTTQKTYIYIYIYMYL